MPKTWKRFCLAWRLFGLGATICLPGYAFAQGGLVALNTGGGQLLVTESRALSVDTNLTLPALEF